MKQWILAAVLAGAAAVWAEGKEVGYVGEEGEWKVQECSVVGSGSTAWSGWLAVEGEGEVEVDGRIEVSGAANVVLCDGATLSAAQGIRVVNGTSLTVWGQRAGSGRLVARGGEDCAGIGGNKKEGGGSVAVYGGRVEAHGGKYGAGIGGGDTGDGGSVEVHGGEVSAVGNEGSAGIGGGDYGNGGVFVITGGRVSATGSTRHHDVTKSGQASAGIGAGRPKLEGDGSVSNGNHRVSGSVSILGGAVSAMAGVPDPDREHPEPAQAMGVNSKDADFNEGNNPGWLSVEGAVAVYTSADAAEPVPAAERAAACRGTNVWTRPCQHEGQDWTCAWCGSGAGTEDDPYLIGSYAALVEFAGKVNGGQWDACGVLTADIAAEGADWVAIGNGNSYTGTFDGAGHTISGLANEGTPEDAGLFGDIVGVVRNVRLAGVEFFDGDTAGGVAGNNEGTVSNCCVSGSVWGRLMAGGIAGVNAGTVANCHNSSAVSSDGEVGGACLLDGSRLLDCIVSGNNGCNGGASGAKTPRSPGAS